MNRRIVVVGAGITGLAAAHRLRELGSSHEVPLEVIVLEATERAGGIIRSEPSAGWLLEGGPDGFITDKPEAIELCRRLGLESELVGVRPEARRSFVVRDGRLHAIPEGFLLMAPTRFGPWLRSPLLSWPGRLRVLLDLVLPRGPHQEESLAAFARRRFGQEAFERLIQPLAAGIYTADAERLSLEAALPRFARLERAERSVILGLRRTRASSGDSGARYGLFASLGGGMGRLVAALVERIGAGTVRLGAAVSHVHPGASAGYEVELESGQSIDCAGVCLALPAHQAARLTERLDRDLAQALAAIPHASSAIVSLGFARSQVTRLPSASGFVVPAREGLPLIACSFLSQKYAARAPEDRQLLRAFFAGSACPELLEQDDQQLVRTACEALEPLIGAAGPPLLEAVHRHAAAMPLYELGHRDRVAAITRSSSRWRGLKLAGNYLDGVGISDCVRSGEAAAEELSGLVAFNRFNNH